MEEPSESERDLMSDIETMLQTIKWPRRVTRKNIGSDPNRRAFALGKVYQYDRPRELVESQYNTRYADLHTALKRLMRLHDPTFRFNSIQLNANVQTEPHHDKNNAGPSYALGLGKFTGGGLVLYPEAGEVRLPNKRRWVRYDGAKTLHGSIPVTSGTRYAIIYFTRKAPSVRSTRRSRGGRRTLRRSRARSLRKK